MVSFNKCRWDEYYLLSKELYAMDNSEEKGEVDLYDLTIEEHNESLEGSSLIVDIKNEKYRQIINRLSSDVSRAFEQQVGTVDRGLGIFIDDIWQFENSLVELGNYIVPTIQEKIFRSYVQVDNIKIYRNIVTDAPDTSSWLWHFDNSPKEQIKILIYLTDVEEGCGEFTFLHNGESGVKIPTSRKSWDDWKDTWMQPPPSYSAPPSSLLWKGTDRVPRQVIGDLERYGYKIRSATGPPGTLFIFDNNIVHKATTARKNHRDAIVMQLKPSIENLNPSINRVNTGSGHLHTTFNVDPSILRALPAIGENSTKSQLQAILGKK